MRTLLPLSSIALLCLLAADALGGPHVPIESRRELIRPHALTRLLQKGELALIEATPEGSSKQIAVMSVIEAPPERVYDAVWDVETYPEFLRNMKSTRVTDRTRTVIGYEWVLDLPVFDLRGHRAMRGQRPRLIEVRGTGGHLRSSSDRWEFYALDGGQQTLAVLYRALDFKDAGLVLKTITELEPSMSNALNLAMGFVQLRSLRFHLEGRPTPSYRRPTGPVPPLTRVELGAGGVRAASIAPLLERGILALVESDEEGALRQVTLWGRVAASPSQVRAVVLEASEYARFIPTFKETKLSKLKEAHLRLEWTLDIPLVSVSGVTDIFPRTDGSVDMLAVSGDVKRARWRWAFEPESPSSTLLAHDAYSDVRESSWLVEKLVDREPLLEHGIVVASSAIGVQAIKDRSEGKRTDSSAR